MFVLLFAYCSDFYA